MRRGGSTRKDDLRKTILDQMEDQGIRSSLVSRRGQCDFVNEFSEYEDLGMFSLEELWMLGERGGLQEAVQEIWMSRDGVHNSFKNHYSISRRHKPRLAPGYRSHHTQAEPRSPGLLLTLWPKMPIPSFLFPNVKERAAAFGAVL